MNGARTWDAVRAFALALPAAAEDFPWGETVVKVVKSTREPPSWRRGLVHGPMFLWLGNRDADVHQIWVKLTSSYNEAMALADAVPTSGSGLGQWGWLTVPLANVDVDIVCEWVEESYRTIAPKRLVAELDAR